MRNNSEVYFEKSRLPLNIFFLFYLYIFFVLIIANLLPVSVVTYFIFLILGISGIFILFMNFSCLILVNEEVFSISLIIPVKVLLLKLKTKEITVAEEVETDSLYYQEHQTKKVKPYYKSYVFKTGKCLKLTMSNGKVFIISCKHSDSIITRLNAYKQVNL